MLAVRRLEYRSQVESFQELFFPTAAKIIHLCCLDLVMGFILPVEVPSKISVSL